MTFLRGFDKAVRTFLAVGTLLLLLLGSPFVYAQDRTAAISQGFETSETNLTTGALLSLESASANSVSLATPENSEQLVGALGNKTLLELDSDSQGVQVVTSGEAPVLVSDLNGEVKNGDKISPSPISGIGMKATKSGTIVGIAQADMSGFEQTERTVKDEDGTNVTVRIALIPVQVNVLYYASPGDASNFLPPFLQAFANTVAGREVSPIRVIIAGLFLLVALVSIAVLLYSSVQSSIISIGRNPLSEGAVRKGLLQVGLTITGILLLTVLAIYLVLIT